MFRTLARKVLPNRLDWMLRRCARRGGKRIALGWNRGLGDIALGLFAIVTRIREWIPDAEVTFVVRENLREGFELLEGVCVVVAPGLKRGDACKAALHLPDSRFDLVIDKPNPTDWVRWQLGKLTPRLKWQEKWDGLWEKFGLEEGVRYVGVQVAAESPYGFWRNWPVEQWGCLFDRLEQMVGGKVLLFGFGNDPQFRHQNVIDLRGKTSLFELLSIVKHRCSHLVLPDSGILSMVYYLDVEFPIRVVSLWADPKHGILKQGVASPNCKLVHVPLIGEYRALETVSVAAVMEGLFPALPLQTCMGEGKRKAGGAIVLAGGQGSRLGGGEPKGTFVVGGKSLFQWIVERAPKSGFPIGVMTSPLNHEETVRFFAERGNFGREVWFFQQEMLPLQGGRRGEMGPAGNGAVFRACAGLIKVFEERGVDRVAVVPVDNALADVT